MEQFNKIPQEETEPVGDPERPTVPVGRESVGVKIWSLIKMFWNLRIKWTIISGVVISIVYLATIKAKEDSLENLFVSVDHQKEWKLHTIFTYIFFHNKPGEEDRQTNGDHSHIASNLLFLLVLGCYLEIQIGNRMLLLMVIATIVGAFSPWIGMVKGLHGSSKKLRGLSPVVYAILGATIVDNICNWKIRKHASFFLVVAVSYLIFDYMYTKEITLSEVSHYVGLVTGILVESISIFVQKYLCK